MDDIPLEDIPGVPQCYIKRKHIHTTPQLLTISIYTY